MMRSTKLDRDDMLWEALIKTAEIEVMQEELNALPSLEELNELYKPSDALEKSIRDMTANNKRNKPINQAAWQLKKIAAIVGILFVLGATALMSVEASRIFILNIFLDLQDDYIAFEFGQNTPSGITGEIVLEFIPEGFELTSTQILENLSIVIYQNADGERIIIRRGNAETMSTAISTGFADFSEVYVNGQEAFLFEAVDTDYQSALMWLIGNNVLTIVAYVDTATMFAIAENIILR